LAYKLYTLLYAIKITIMILKNVEHELTLEEKRDFIQTLNVDEIFDLINWNTGMHHKGFPKQEIIERILDDNPEYLISAKKVSDIIDQLPEKSDTVIEAFALQELNKLF